MDKKRLFLVVAVFWLVIFLLFIVNQEYTKRTGEEVLLETEPIDPRDLFRGDYVILNYKINRLEAGKFGLNTSNIEEDDEVFLSLYTEEGYGKPKEFALEEPDEDLYIKGNVESVWRDSLEINYGIGIYFIPEGEGELLENSEDLDVKVFIDERGNAVIDYLLIEGEKVDFSGESS